MRRSSAIQDIEWRMMEAEKEGDLEKANRILGEFEAHHAGLLAARMHCEVGVVRESESQALAANIVNEKNNAVVRPMALVLDELFIDFLALSCRKAVLLHLALNRSSLWWRSRARQSSPAARARTRRRS